MIDRDRKRRQRPLMARRLPVRAEGRQNATAEGGVAVKREHAGKTGLAGRIMLLKADRRFQAAEGYFARPRLKKKITAPQK